MRIFNPYHDIIIPPTTIGFVEKVANKLNGNSNYNEVYNRGVWTHDKQTMVKIIFDEIIANAEKVDVWPYDFKTKYYQPNIKQLFLLSRPLKTFKNRNLLQKIKLTMRIWL